jgi:hypothetical protein
MFLLPPALSYEQGKEKLENERRAVNVTRKEKRHTAKAFITETCKH